MGKQRVFDHYKGRLERLGDDNLNRVRLLVIEYQCSFAKIDPEEMAVALMKDGYRILYDDASISREKNRQKEEQIARIYNKEASRYE